MLERDTGKKFLTLEWKTSKQVADEMRSAGPESFANDEEYLEFRRTSSKKQYLLVYNRLVSLKDFGKVLCKEPENFKQVRMYKLLEVVEVRCWFS